MGLIGKVWAAIGRLTGDPVYSYAYSAVSQKKNVKLIYSHLLEKYPAYGNAIKGIIGKAIEDYFEYAREKIRTSKMGPLQKKTATEALTSSEGEYLVKLARIEPQK